MSNTLYKVKVIEGSYITLIPEDIFNHNNAHSCDCKPKSKKIKGRFPITAKYGLMLESFLPNDYIIDIYETEISSVYIDVEAYVLIHNKANISFETEEK
jgi:hypothetical protein